MQFKYCYPIESIKQVSILNRMALSNSLKILPQNSNYKSHNILSDLSTRLRGVSSSITLGRNKRSSLFKQKVIDGEK